MLQLTVHRQEARAAAEIAGARSGMEEEGTACLTGIAEGKPCRPDAINLRLCTICGFTVDLSYEAQKPSIEFGMAGRGNTRAATSTPKPEYTREEMREACRNNYHAGAAVGADLAAQVAQLVARVESLTVQIARLTGNKK